ncbi:CYTH domain-containing protein [Shewanella mesophila]|uniref:CYTH domain-containing protein n=1 Tax=Shewanella mesophila TaxID=2864208 RepID=UPI001C6594FC|nr:CYTH domain-containing protein [Shewanella mesophila]QYJ86800.1 CYTH domain-containing protein [Shewanella mesophila]
MEAEIELKLFFPEKAREALVSLLDSLPHSEPKGSKHLSNSYFDTPDLQLRHWDMGLRIRGCDACFEQTIKTAGTVVGGVHSRPEYNIDIDQAKVNLSLFPEQIWPSGANIEQVEQQLQSLFETDFTRMKWHIYLQDSLVEVALDIGTVSANGMIEPICELEFELLAGDTQALLTLAEGVAKQIPTRLGRASKAERGYRLAAMASPLQLEALEFIKLGEVNSLKQAFITLLSTGIERWQLLESMLLDATDCLEQLPLLSYRLRACARLIRCSLSQFDLLDAELNQEFDCIERHLEYVESGLSLTELLDNDAALLASLPQAQQIAIAANQGLVGLNMPSAIDAMLADICYGHLQLKLVNLLFEVKAGKINLDVGMGLQHFANKMQEASWQRITQMMPSQANLNSEDYQSFARALDESIFVGVAYGELYDGKARDQFRAPWRDLVLGIRTLAAYRSLNQLSNKLNIDLQDWLENKEHSLLFAMEHSRRSALKAQPYW